MPIEYIVSAFVFLCGVIAFLYKSAQSRQDAGDAALASALKEAQAKLEAKQAASEAQCRAEQAACQAANAALSNRVIHLEGKQTDILERMARTLEKMTDTEVIRKHSALEPHDFGTTAERTLSHG